VRKILGGSVSRRLRYSTRRLAPVKKLLARDAVRSYVKGGRWHAFLPVTPLPNVVEQAQINQIVNGQWGAFFLASPIGGALTGANIGQARIDKMFKWGKTCRGMVSGPIYTGYARAIIDLLALPTGQSLFQNIIIQCNTNRANNHNPNIKKRDVRPERLVFVQDGGATGLIYESSMPSQCGLNLEWDPAANGGNGALMEGHNVLIVNNTVAGALDFVGVAIPPALDLAHELGHFLYALNTPRAVGVGNDVYNSVSWRAQGDYMTIFAGILVPPPPVPRPRSFKRFRKLWNHINYSEPVNILPSANMGVAGFTYSDGIMIGEALNAWPVGNPRRPLFFRLTNAAGVAGAAPVPILANAAGIMTDANGNALTPERFIRFSHRNSVGFFNAFNGLNAAVPAGAPPGTLSEQDQFRALVGQLLNNIALPVAPLAVAPAAPLGITDLPRI
jgi:hypothetical protein